MTDMSLPGVDDDDYQAPLPSPVSFPESMSSVAPPLSLDALKNVIEDMINDEK